MNSFTKPEGIDATLSQIVDLELSLGNEIERVDLNEWEKCKIFLVFKRRLHFLKIEETIILPATIERWKYEKGRYELQEGFFDTTSKQAIAGPL